MIADASPPLAAWNPSCVHPDGEVGRLIAKLLLLLPKEITIRVLPALGDESNVTVKLGPDTLV